MKERERVSSFDYADVRDDDDDDVTKPPNQANYYAPWECDHERHTFETCEYKEVSSTLCSCTGTARDVFVCDNHLSAPVMHIYRCR